MLHIVLYQIHDIVQTLELDAGAAFDSETRDSLGELHADRRPFVHNSTTRRYCLSADQAKPSNMSIVPPIDVEKLVAFILGH